MTAANPSELYSLLVPLASARMLVPRSCVAEVAGFRVPDEDATREPRWLLGHIAWSGHRVPVISFEDACGIDSALPTGRTRVVVFHALTDALDVGYFAVVTTGFPQLVRVHAGVLEHDTSADWPDDSPVLCQLRMINQRPLVPDIGRLERMIARAESQATA